MGQRADVEGDSVQLSSGYRYSPLVIVVQILVSKQASRVGSSYLAPQSMYRNVPAVYSLFTEPGLYLPLDVTGSFTRTLLNGRHIRPLLSLVFFAGRNSRSKIQRVIFKAAGGKRAPESGWCYAKKFTRFNFNPRSPCIFWTGAKLIMI